MVSLFKSRGWQKLYASYWAAYLVIFSLIQGLPSGNLFIAFRNELISLPPKIIFVTLAIILLGELLINKKVWRFVLVYTFVVVVFAFLLRLIDNYIILKYFLTWWKKESLISAPPFLYNAIKLQFVATVPSIISILNFQTSLNNRATAASAENGTQISQSPNLAFLMVKSERKVIKVAIGQISYLEAQGNYVIIFSGQKVIKTYMSISELEQQLPASVFVRIHRSFIIAIDKVESFAGTHVEINGQKIPIGRSYQVKLKNGLQFS